MSTEPTEPAGDGWARGGTGSAASCSCSTTLCTPAGSVDTNWGQVGRGRSNRGESGVTPSFSGRGAKSSSSDTDARGASCVADSCVRLRFFVGERAAGAGGTISLAAASFGVVSCVRASSLSVVLLPFAGPLASTGGGGGSCGCCAAAATGTADPSGTALPFAGGLHLRSGEQACISGSWRELLGMFCVSGRHAAARLRDAQ